MTRATLKPITAALFLSLFGAGTALAATPITINCISGGNCQSLASALAVGVSGSDNSLTFSFGNSLADGVIAQIYFSGSGFLNYGSYSFTQSSGVSFASGSNPPNLPGGNGISFSASQSFGADVPAPKNGIGSGESLGITFSLLDNTSYQTALNAVSSGSLRVGMHVISLPQGASASFVSAVPEPATYAMLLAGLGVIGTVARVRNKASQR